MDLASLQTTVCFIIICVEVVCSFRTTNVSEIEICQQQNQTIQEQLHIKSPGFPNAWTSQIKCLCEIEGTDIVIATRTLVLMGDLSTSVLEITYRDNETVKTWPRDETKTIYDEYNRKLVIAVNVTKVKLSVDTSKTENPGNAFNILFMFDFKVSDPNTRMSVSCWKSSSSDEPNTNDKESPGILETVGSFCSPQLVIILGALSCSLLLIVLVISIVLCCIVPRRRNTYTIDYRNQQVTDEKKLRKAEKSGRESVIYDDAKINLRASAGFNNIMNNDRQPVSQTFNRQPVSQTYSNTNSMMTESYSNTDTDQHYFNSDSQHGLQRSFTVPAACSRQSAQYVNTSYT